MQAPININVETPDETLWVKILITVIPIMGTALILWFRKKK